MNFKLTGTASLNRKVNRIVRNLKYNKKPVEDAGQVVLNAVKQETPVQTGNLKSHTKMRRERDSVYIGADAQAKYMFYVIRGTRHTKPNPYHTRALKRSKNRAVGKAIEGYKKLL